MACNSRLSVLDTSAPPPPHGLNRPSQSHAVKFTKGVGGSASEAEGVTRTLYVWRLL